MDVLTFIAGVVEHLAWPVAVVTLAMIFREEFRVLLRNLRRGKVGSAEFEFERGVASLEANAQDLIEASDTDSDDSSVKRLARLHPRAAILEAWMRLEDQIIDAATRMNLANPTAHRYALGALRGLRESQLLPANRLAVLDELQDLRNQAAHDPEFAPTPGSVITYVHVAENLGAEIEELSK